MPHELITSNSVALTFAAWVGCLAFAAFFVNQLLNLFGAFREKPAPSATYFRIDTAEARLAAMKRDHETDVKELRDEISVVRADTREDLRRIHERIDNLPSQIVATLRNTGAIK